MEKDELLNELHKLNRFEVSDGMLDFMSKTAVKLNHVLALVEQLNEPEKVVIPQFVADWIETTKKYSRAISALMNYEGINNESHELALWCFESGNDDNLHNLARAWLDGFEIEKEPLYYVKLPNTNSEREYLYLVQGNSTGKCWFIRGLERLDYEADVCNHQFTEQEIKLIDPRYWKFAEPVGDSTMTQRKFEKGWDEVIGWIARDKDNELYFFDQEPFRDGEIWNANFSASSMCLDDFLLSHSIKWEDEPVKVEITLKEVSE